MDGEPVVGFEITRARGAGEIEVADAVRMALAALKQGNPEITITEAFNFADPVVENYDGSMALLCVSSSRRTMVLRRRSPCRCRRVASFEIRWRCRNARGPY